MNPDCALKAKDTRAQAGMVIPDRYKQRVVARLPGWSRRSALYLQQGADRGGG